ncbi:hypothetical protein LJB95_03015 [Paludibacteraceae bacterium OttesenSCG-928-F17]|nr:hypothetical protein [Paludibacteraceae bacterium OttesenSCG-928-F17]
MGSTGSGSFTDYSSYKSSNNGAGGNSGGSSGADQCARAFSTLLEEVSICDYYTTKGLVPPNHTEIIVIFDGTRIAALDIKEGLLLGFLPTQYNYLRACIEGDYSYVGVVSSSSLTSVPSVTIDVKPSK